MTRTPERLELISQGQCGSIYNLRTNRSVNDVLAAGHFQSVHPDSGLRKGDRVHAVCHYDSDNPQFITLAVMSAGKKGDARVEQLK